MPLAIEQKQTYARERSRSLRSHRSVDFFSSSTSRSRTRSPIGGSSRYMNRIISKDYRRPARRDGETVGLDKENIPPKRREQQGRKSHSPATSNLDSETREERPHSKHKASKDDEIEADVVDDLLSLWTTIPLSTLDGQIRCENHTRR